MLPNRERAGIALAFFENLVDFINNYGSIKFFVGFFPFASLQGD
jgi:hypothetical protein